MGCRSRPWNSAAGSSPGQSASTRPPCTAPPSSMAADAVPWSVPPVPLAATVRPNSVATSTTVSAHAGPRPSRKAATIASRLRSCAASRGPCALCVSQPPVSSIAMRGPAGCARKRAASRPSSAGLCRAGAPAMPRAPSAAAHMACSCGSAAYSCCTRCTKSSGACAMPDGACELTPAAPRSASGTAGVMAMAASPAGLRGSSDTSRFSQPSLSACGAAPPVSSTFCASKCERSR